MKNKVVTKTAVFNGKYFEHFDICPITASLYGNKESDIIEVELSIADNQTKPTSNDKNMDADYWGWMDNKKQDFTMVYAKRFLLDMCFPAGIDGTEKFGDGKAYRLNVTLKKK